MNTPKAIIFDMDGVLLDSERVWAAYEQKFWKEINVELTPAIKERIHAISVPEEYRIIHEEFGIDMTYDEYEKHYDNYAQEVYAQASLANDIDSTLAELKRKGIRLGIVSASLEPWINLVLKRITPDTFAGKISISTSNITPKPAPDGYLKMAEKFNLSPSECIVVEDSNRGILSGKNAGMYTVATREFVDSDYEQKGFDVQIEQLEDLLKLFS